MAAISGPNIPLDGLVLNIDPASALSYPNKSATTIKDIKNDTLGTFTNGPVYSSAQKGAISFDGSDDYIIIPANSNLTFGTADFAIELWFKTSNKTASYPNIIGTNSAWTTNVWSLTDRHASLNPTKLTLHVYNIGNNVLVSNTAIQNNTWYHLVITRIGSNFYMYLNGVLESTYTSSNSFDGGVSNNISVGIANNSTNAYNGSIPYLRVYKNRGFSLKDVLKNYNATRERFVEIPKTISGLQLWLDAADLSTLRQNSNGTTAVALASDPIGYWADKSGNGRNVLQATSSYRPTLSISSMNMVQFNGTSHYIELASTLSLSDMTIFWIGILDESPSNGTAMFHGANTSDSLNMYLAGYYWYQTSDILQGANSSWSISQLTLSELSRLSGTWNIKHNNVTKTATLNSSTSAVIKGMGKAYSGYSQMRVGEILIYNTYLSEYDRSIIKNYLNKKWGVF